MFLLLLKKKLFLKQGRIVPLRSSNTVAAADVKVGEKVLFSVSRDINVGGVTVIPYGTAVSGKVTLAKRSSWWGTRGRLTVDINELLMPDGTVIPLQNGNIKILGKNRTVISVVLFAVVIWPACFLCGSKAEMQAGYEIQANIASNVTLKID